MNEKNSELHLVFPTPIWTSVIDNYKNINKKLYNFIYSHKEVDENGIQVSNQKGWHSKNFELKNENVIFFVNSISSKIKIAMEDMGWDEPNNKIEISNNPKCLLLQKRNEKISRNEKCEATGKKYKNCCGAL